ncbi:MAG: mechanosensitive ion channel [Bacteroidetes bacterium]|nr:mechanosensitive ion channel [Bacteroidota bacterium]
MKAYRIIWFCGWMVVQVGVLAQPRRQRDTAGVDTVRHDTAHTAEKLLLEQQKRAEVDSALRAQLQTEMKRSSGNQERTRELQGQLSRLLAEDSSRRADQLRRIAELKKNTPGFPVVLNEDTIFRLYTKMGSFGAEERAEAVSRRVTRLYKDYAFSPDSLRLLPTEDGFDIAYRSDLIVMSVSKLDALWFDTSVDSLAADYRARIGAEVLKEKKANSWNNWVRRIAWMAVVLMGLAIFVAGLRWLFRRTTYYVRRNREKFAHGLRFRKYQLITPLKLEQLVLQACSALRFVLVLLAGYIALLLISGLFTATEKWTDTLLSWILTPARKALHGFVHFLPDLFTIIVIWFIFRFVVKGVKYLAGEIGKGTLVISGFHRDWAQPTFNIVKFLLYAFMVVLIFPYLPGSASPAFKGVSVFLGVLISLGSSSAINNIVAGLVITYMRPFKVGDRVQIGEVTGDVLEKNMLVTRIRTIKNEDVTVPNSMVLSASSVNFSANIRPEDAGLILHTTVTIGYDTPWKKIHAALLEAAGRTDRVEKSPEPFVLQTGLDDFYVSYQLNVYSKEPNRQATIYSQLHQHIQDACNEAGIEIMSPHYQSMRDGNATTIPGDYLPKDYEAPPFIVRRQKDAEE